MTGAAVRPAVWRVAKAFPVAVLFAPRRGDARYNGTPSMRPSMRTPESPHHGWRRLTTGLLVLVATCAGCRSGETPQPGRGQPTVAARLLPDRTRLIAAPELARKLAGSPMALFRFVNEAWTEATCAALSGEVPLLPTARLHGDAHVEQYAMTATARGLDDFDDSARGPAAIDLVRFVGGSRRSSGNGGGRRMTVEIRIERHAAVGRAEAIGAFDLGHANAIERALEDAEARLASCEAVEVDLVGLQCVDGSGAALLARFVERLDTGGRRARLVADRHPEAERLIAVYLRNRGAGAVTEVNRLGMLTRIGASAAALPATVNSAFDFIGRCAVAVPRAIVAPASVDWRSLPTLLQAIGADALPVTGAANLLVGVIIGFIGVSQLGRFGAVAYVPELVVIAHFRELGPLVTAIVVAGRSGAGLASEIATMKVSEEIDALRSMGFDPVTWLVVPRCLALAIVVPLLTWIGDVLALAGGLAATIAMTDMTPRAYVAATAEAITAAHFLGGLVKTPFLALAIGMVACGQGLATQGGAAAVGARTTTAVVLAMLLVIVISAVFTSFYTFLGI